MYLTIHPLDRLPTPGEPATGAQNWADDVLTLVSATPAGTPRAAWVTAQLGSSTGAVVALWPDEPAARTAAAVEGSTPARINVSPGTPLHCTRQNDGPAAGQKAGIAQLTWFDGPRSAVQHQADKRSGDRVSAAVQDLPGYGGSLVAHAPDLGYVVVVFSDSLATLEQGQTRILTSRLGPDEDPALLTGPDSMQVTRVVRATATLTDLHPSTDSDLTSAKA
jgi:hypothetical protein